MAVFSFLQKINFTHAFGVGMQILMAVAMIQGGETGSVPVSINGKKYILSLAPEEK